MVSGLVISPKLHSNIRSGEASRIATASKSCGMTSFFFIAIQMYIVSLEVLRAAFKFDVDAQAPQMSDQDIEGGRSITFFNPLAGDYCVEGGGTAQDVVGFDGEYLA